MPDLRGRRPKPADIRLVDGNAGKRAQSPAEAPPADAAAGEPKPPEGLPPMPRRVEADPLAREKWQELVVLTTLPGSRVLSLADGPMLELCCLSYSRWLQAEEAGYWNRAEKHERAYERRLSHFGLSPAMRAKVERLPDQKPANAAARHFR